MEEHAPLDGAIRTQQQRVEGSGVATAAVVVARAHRQLGHAVPVKVWDRGEARVAKDVRCEPACEHSAAQRGVVDHRVRAHGGSRAQEEHEDLSRPEHLLRTDGELGVSIAVEVRQRREGAGEALRRQRQLGDSRLDARDASVRQSTGRRTLARRVQVQDEDGPSHALPDGVLRGEFGQRRDAQHGLAIAVCVRQRCERMAEVLARRDLQWTGRSDARVRLERARCVQAEQVGGSRTLVLADGADSEHVPRLCGWQRHRGQRAAKPSTRGQI